MNHKPKIFIAGGGIAGLTLSLFLDPERYAVHIFEKKQVFTEVGAAISVFPNALAVLDSVGLLQDILVVSGEITNSSGKTWNGKSLVNTAFKSEYPIICMHRSDLHHTLLKHTKAKLYAEKEIIGYENQINNVLVKFSDGTIDYCDLLIGADGLHSKIREHMIHDGDPVYRGSNIWRGVVKSNFSDGYASETWGHGKRVGIVPIKDGYFGWWATIPEDQFTEDLPTTSEKLKAAFADWHNPIPEFIQNTEHIIKNALVDRKIVNGWSDGRVVLIGDAAHPTTPNLGQGGCMAMEGAQTLALCIEKYGISKEALDRYEILHFPRAKQIVNDSLRFGKLAALSNSVAISLRNIAFKITPSFISQKLFDSYFNYRVGNLKI